MEITERSATDLARAIRDGELSSREVVEAHVERARRLNPDLNAIAAERFDLALAEADAADERVRGGEDLPPFLGVTNTSEATMWIESSNRLYGRTNNAYHPKRTAGGSSGGEGAAIGAGFAPIGLGSDIGGSIRLPAFFNGVFGHKPSPGIIPCSGHFPA